MDALLQSSKWDCETYEDEPILWEEKIEWGRTAVFVEIDAKKYVLGKSG